MGTIDDGKHAKVQSAARKGHWVIDDASPMKLFVDGMTFEEQTIKLYEDFLSDLGLASLTCRCRHGPAGFELRLRWRTPAHVSCFDTANIIFVMPILAGNITAGREPETHRFASVNPECAPKRGFPF